MKRLKLSHYKIIAAGFLILIFIGAVLLCLPVSSRNGAYTGFADSLFTSTSATCVTGLVVFDTWTHWSLFGQIVILVLIQIGGLGLMTLITLFSFMLRKKIALHQRTLIMQSAGNTQLSGIVGLLRRIIRGTMLFEGVGAVLLAIRFCPQMGTAQGIYYAVFHSVSAFCNAGFDLMGQFGQSSFTAYSGDALVCLTLMGLTTIGGLGFMVWSDCKKTRLHFEKTELHTKIVLISTLVLLIGGSIVLYFTESGGFPAGISEAEKWLCAFFQSSTTRTAGFNTISQSGLSESGSLFSMLLMFIGGSPGSTAGGIKTTTAVVLIIGTISCIRNEQGAVVFRRNIDKSVIKQASAIALIYLLCAFTATFTICAIEPVGIKEAAYEVISAICTVGLTMDLTSSLGLTSHIILIFLMYIGRLGGLSLFLALAEKKIKVPIERPSEKILIG